MGGELGARQWQAQGNTGALAQGRLYFHLTLVVVGDDEVGNRQPKPGALADFLGGEKRFEGALAHVFTHAYAVVFNLNFRPGRIQAGAQSDPPWFSIVFTLVNGLRTSLEASADPLNLVVMRKGADSELLSVLLRPTFQDLKFKPGIARGRDGQPLASLEVVAVLNLPSVSNPNGSNITVRGLPPVEGTMAILLWFMSSGRDDGR